MALLIMCNGISLSFSFLLSVYLFIYLLPIYYQGFIPPPTVKHRICAREIVKGFTGKQFEIGIIVASNQIRRSIQFRRVSAMTSTGVNLSSIHGLGEVDEKAVKLEQNLESQDDSRLSALNTEHGGSHIWDKGQSSIDDLTLCSTSSITPAPISRQFWNAGYYDETLNSKPTCGVGTGYLRIHPKFLHSNATSHKWVFGAIAELVDNAVDETHNGATFVVIDKTSNPRDGTPALLIQDDGGGMGTEAMRHCMSFGFSDKKSKTTIGQYGNGFKTSSMRLGADVVVFSRHKDRNSTQSVGLLSYTFLMQTRHDRIVVPMVDYQFDAQNGTWNSLHDALRHENNLSILLQWSPFSTEAELLKQCDDVGPHGTRIIIYNLWHDDQGKMELNFESDPEDICISAKETDTARVHSRMALSEQHLANRLHCSLRAYLSILYLRIPQNFFILLCRRVVIYHSIANDLKFPEFILYKPQNVEGQVVTTVGFLKEAPNVNIHGFNVYHKNRLILPFWHVVSYACSRGRGVVGVLEANFIEPTHNKQEFERTPVFQKLESRLKDMTQEYWDYHCGLIGYQPKKQPRPVIAQFSSDSTQDRGTYQRILLGKDSLLATGAKFSAAAGHEINGSLNRMAPNRGVALKRKGNDHLVESEREKKMAVKGPRTASVVHGQGVQHSVAPANILEPQEAVSVIQENQKRHAQCEEYKKTEEELNFMITRLRAEIQEARREYTRLLLESKFLDRVKSKNCRVT